MLAPTPTASIERSEGLLCAASFRRTARCSSCSQAPVELSVFSLSQHIESRARQKMHRMAAHVGSFAQVSPQAAVGNIPELHARADRNTSVHTRPAMESLGYTRRRARVRLERFRQLHFRPLDQRCAPQISLMPACAIGGRSGRCQETATPRSISRY